MPKLVLKICGGTWENASRDKRELSVCRELGAKILVLAKGSRDDKGRPEVVDGFEVRRYTTRPLKHVPNIINQIFSLFTWASYVKKIKPDVISGHDMIGILIGWLSTWFTLQKNKPKIIYDSHEFQLGLDVYQNKIIWWTICFLERFLIKRCELVIMVSESIADEVQKIHKLKKKPIVVRNMPSKWKLDTEKIEHTKRELYRKFSKEDAFIILYHGGIMSNRGIEKLLEATSKVKDIVIVILGNGTPSYLNYLQELTVSLEVNDRVIFLPAVPIEKLNWYVGAADIGVSLLQGTSQNHIWALPNKFFENIQCLTPVIVSDFPDIGKIVDEYKIGIKVNPEDSLQIAEAIRQLYNDKLFYAECKKNMRLAKDELCWEKEKQILVKAYQAIL